jgi:hypothetical protein
MATTDRIAARGTANSPFPKNILWAFEPTDQRRLKHFPDPYVRPGGVPFGDASDSAWPLGTADALVSSPGLVFRVSALLETVPFGAPVRVEIELRNEGQSPVPAPSTLSMKTGWVSGSVIDPGDTARTFKPLIVCVEHDKLEPLAPGQSVNHSLTLLRGADGALFRSPGLFKIVVNVEWEMKGLGVSLTGEASVLVLPPGDDAHAQVSKLLLTTPDAHLTLVFGGDHLPKGVNAIGAAINNPTLRKHYAYTEARRVGERFQHRQPNLKAAADLIQADSVMSPAEIGRAAEIVQRSALHDEDDEPARAIARVLKDKIQTTNVPEAVRTTVNSLKS